MKTIKYFNGLTLDRAVLTNVDEDGLFEIIIYDKNDEKLLSVQVQKLDFELYP